MTYEIWELSFFEDPDYEESEWFKEEGTVTVSAKDEIIDFVAKKCDEEKASSSWYDDCNFFMKEYDNGDIRGILESPTVGLWIEARPI